MFRKTDTLNRITELEYDPNGNVKREVTPRGHEFLFTYDDNDQLIKKITPENAYDLVYNVRGQLVSAQNDESLVTFDRDVKGRVRSTTVTGRGSLNSYPATTVNYTFNANDDRTSMTDSWGGSFTYAYYADGRPQSIVTGEGEAYTFTFDGRDRLMTLSRPGIDTTFSYGTNSFVASITHNSSGVVKSFFNYTRNDEGFVTAITTESGSSTFQYDLNSYLTSATQPAARLPASEGSFANELFNYDEIGNRSSDQEGSYTFDTTRQSLLEGPRYTYQHDNSGNMVGKIDKLSGEYTKYEYSSENQLLGIKVFSDVLSSKPLKEVAYFYDAVGRRMKKEVIEHANLNDSHKTFTRQYVHDGEEILLEFDENSNVLARYTHSSLQTDDVLAVGVTPEGVTRGLSTAAGTFTFLKDQMGTVYHVANASGAILQSYAYSAYGVLLGVRDATGDEISGPSPVNTSFNFAGRELDRESGLYFYRARYYDPKLGRYLQQDSHPGHIDDPLSYVNKYGCANNNPLNYYDPNGRLPHLVVAALMALAQVVIETAFMEGNYWENFNNAFDRPGGSGNKGSYWEHFAAYAIGIVYFNVDVSSLANVLTILSFTAAGLALEQQTEEKGYHWQLVKGVKIGWINDAFRAAKYIRVGSLLYGNRVNAYWQFSFDYFNVTGAVPPWIE